MIYKGLDDEEASFLNVVVDQHDLQVRNMINRERKELSAYRVCSCNSICSLNCTMTSKS